MVAMPDFFFPPSLGRRCPEGAEVGLDLLSPSANPLPFQRKGIDEAQFLLSNLMGRSPKVRGEQVSRLGVPIIIRLTANNKDFSLRSK